MSKELEYVEELKLICQEKIGVIRRLNAIETALKNYAELTNKPVILCGRTHGYTQSLIDTICKNYKEVKITNLEDEKKLKALEIIKNTRVDTNIIKESKDYDDYCGLEAQKMLTLMFSAPKQIGINEEQYDLVKEVLL